MAQSPKVTNLSAETIAANFVKLAWDEIGGFFVFRIQRAKASDNIYLDIGTTNDSYFWDKFAVATETYHYKVTTIGDGFTESDEVNLSNITTFTQNLYSILSSNRVNPYLSFVNNKLKLNDNSFVNFNTDEIRVALVNTKYIYNVAHSLLEDIISDGTIVANVPNPKRYGAVPELCSNSTGSHSVILKHPISGNETLLILEERQRVALSSTNYGVEWKRVNVVKDSVIGKATSNGLACGNANNTFVLGYDKIHSQFDGSGSLLYNDINTPDPLDVTFEPSKGHRLYNYMNYPAGIAGGKIQALTCDATSLYAAAEGKLFKTTSLGVSPSWDIGTNIGTTPINTNSAITKIEEFNGFVFVLVVGRFNAKGKITQYDNSALTIPYPDDDTEQGVMYDDIGLYRYNGGSWIKMYGITDAERKKIRIESNISRSSSDIILGLANGASDIIDLSANGINDISIDVTDPDNPVYELDNGLVSNFRPYRSVYYSVDGTTFTKNEERYRFEENHTYINGDRMWTDYNRYFARLTNNNIQTKIVNNTSELWENGEFNFYCDDVTFYDFIGTAKGAIIYRKGATNLEGNLIAYYDFPSLERDIVEVNFPIDRLLLKSILANQALPPETLVTINQTRYIHPSLEPLIQKMIPEEYISDSSLFTEFVKEYLRFLSDKNDSVYGTLNRLQWNQDVNETEIMENFFGELYQRNIYVDETKRQLVNKFFTNRNHDFLSIKGTLDSYKFLFKLLYDVDIEVGLESSSKFEFYIDVDTNNITDELVGSTIYSDTGSANITYIKTKYENGLPYYEFTLNNIYGEILENDSLKSIQVENWNGTSRTFVKGKDISNDSSAYTSRLKSYYTITIKSELPVGMYKNTVMKFVHPLGFNFLGIYLIVSTVDSGLSLSNSAVENRNLYEFRWSAGVPNIYPTLIPNLNGDGTYKYTNNNPYYSVGYETFQPNAGGFGIQKTYLMKTPTSFTGGAAFPLPTTLDLSTEPPTPIAYNVKYNTILRGLDADNRRVAKSPTFDQSNARFFDFTDWLIAPNNQTPSLSVNIGVDDPSKSCLVTFSTPSCTNTYNLTTTVTNSTGTVIYLWEIISGNGVFTSGTTSSTATIEISGVDGDNFLTTVRCTITDDVTTDIDTLTLSSSHSISNTAIQATILSFDNTSDPLLTSKTLSCDFPISGSCQNAFILKASATGGSGLFNWFWTIDDPTFIISSSTAETITVTRTNAGGNESPVANLKLRATDTTAINPGDPSAYDEDINVLSSTHTQNLNPNVVVTESLDQICYFPAAGTCNITWNISSAPSGGVGPYDVAWVEGVDPNNVFSLSATVGTSTIVTGTKPVGTSPIFENVEITTNVTDQGSVSIGSKVTLLEATFLETISGDITSPNDATISCEYTTGTCTNEWTLVANPTGGYNDLYTYAWSKTAGDAEVVIVGSTTNSTLIVQGTNPSSTSGTYTGTFECLVTDTQDSSNFATLTPFVVTSIHAASTALVNLSGTPTFISANSQDSGVSIANISFNSDGTFNTVVSPDGIPPNFSGNYISSTNGALYEIYISYVSGDAGIIEVNSAMDTWIPINTTRTLGMEFSGYGAGSVRLEYTIREIANPTTNTQTKQTTFNYENT